MTPIQALILALVQGLTELFPVSSLGHAVVLPALLQLHIDENGAEFLPFLVVLHVGTLVALLAYFWREWIGIVRGILRAPEKAEAENYRRLFGLLVVGTLPAVVIGFVLEKPLRALFGAPEVAAVFLVINGVLLLLGERMRRRALLESPTVRLDDLRWRDALRIGFWQCAAFLPGISRSGAAMIGGLRSGLDHVQAARFSFLLTAPVITGAAVLEVPKLLHIHHTSQTVSLGVLFAAGAVAGVAAFLSTAFLMRYFRKHETAGLKPYAVYCMAFGFSALALLGLH